MGRIASFRLAGTWVLLAVLLMAPGVLVREATAAPLKQGQISYLRNGDIYVFDLATRRTIQLTSRGDIGNFAWSPYYNGQLIAFETEGGMSSDIYTMNFDGTNIKPVAITPADETSPAFEGNGTLYYVQHTLAGSLAENRIMEHDAASAPPEQDRQLYHEPGGLCRITDMAVLAAPFMLVSRDCGRGKNVSVIDISKGKETPMSSDKCLLDAVWAPDIGTVAAIQTDCEPNVTTARIATFNPNDGTRSSLLDTPDKGLGSVDWAPGGTGFFTDFVYGNENGLWLVSYTGAATKISSVGGPPRWRPGSEGGLPFSTGSGTQPTLPGMPATGQAQAVDDYLAWGALIACVAIVAGLILVTRRRRKGGDGL